MAYVEVALGEHAPRYGVGHHPSIITASLQALTSAVNRAWQETAARLAA